MGRVGARLAVLLWSLALAPALALPASPAAAAGPLYPPPNNGSGAELTTGGGTGAGVDFRPLHAIATYDGTLGAYVLYLSATPVACNNTSGAKTPYLTISVVTNGSPLVVGKPSVQHGSKNFVQADFYVSATHYYAVQPHVRLVLTSTSATRGALWHGRLTVPKTRFEGKTFAYSGTFAATWCGKV